MCVRVCRSMMLQKVQCLMLCKAEEETVLSMIERRICSCRGESRSMFAHAFHNYLQHGFPMVSCDVALVIVVLSLLVAPDKCDAGDSDAGSISIGRLL